MASDRASLLSFLRPDRLYVEMSETPEYCSPPWGRWLTCGDCGWDGPMRDEWEKAERDRWRHPRLLCWLGRRAEALRFRYAMLPWRRPVPPCDRFGHTWSGSHSVTAPRAGDRCYCGRAKWRTRRV